MGNIKEIKNELREIRNLNKRGIINEKSQKYKQLFSLLPALEAEVMTECYINGKSYSVCGRKVAYCERQVKRIVHRSIERLSDITNGREL